MAMDMFIAFTPDVKGESKDKAFKDKIDVLAWSWGMSQAGNFQMGGGGGAGKANVQDLSFTKYLDNSSPTLQLACLTGKHYDTVVLSIRKAGESPYVYLKITLSKAIISSVSTGGSGGEDRLTENVTINFAKVQTDYFLQGDKGAVTAGPTYTFDIEANVKA